MISVIANALKTGLQADLGVNNPNYSDYIVQSVQERLIKTTDPDRTIAIIEVDQVPQSHEIGQISHTISRYSVEIQILAKSTSEDESRTIRRTLVKRVEKALFKRTGTAYQTYTNLCGLTDTSDDTTERLLKWYIGRIEYMSGRIQTGFASLAIITLILDTETNYD